MAHTCTPTRWRGPVHDLPDDAGRHSLAAAGTTYGFAESQLQAAVLTGYQVLLRLKPGIAEAIVRTRRFPTWTHVVGDDAQSATAFVQMLHCRRLAEALTGHTGRPSRAILCLGGWMLLASDLQWRRPMPDSSEPSAQRHTDDYFSHWVHAIVQEASPVTPQDDGERDVRELAATTLKRWDVPGPLLATFAVQRLSACDGPDSLQLVDALAGDATAVARVAVAARHASDGRARSPAELRPLLVAALNPPLCVSLLSAEDPVPGWPGMQPGLRFLHLCRSLAVTPERPLSGTSTAQQLEQVDALCVRLGGPTLSLQLLRAEQAREEINALRNLSEVAQWLREFWDLSAHAESRVPPGTYACTRYIAFLDAFLLTRGGLVENAAGTDLATFTCDPVVAAAGGPLPLAWKAALLHIGAIDIVAGLMDGSSLDELAARTCPVLAAWPEIADSLAPVLRLPTLEPSSAGIDGIG
jgi:hypothetical protein